MVNQMKIPLLLNPEVCAKKTPLSLLRNYNREVLTNLIRLINPQSLVANITHCQLFFVFLCCSGSLKNEPIFHVKVPTPSRGQNGYNLKSRKILQQFYNSKYHYGEVSLSLSLLPTQPRGKVQQIATAVDCKRSKGTTELDCASLPVCHSHCLPQAPVVFPKEGQSAKLPECAYKMALPPCLQNHLQEKGCFTQAFGCLKNLVLLPEHHCTPACPWRELQWYSSHPCKEKAGQSFSLCNPYILIP